MGVLPPTYYLAIKNGIVYGEFKNRLEIVYSLGISISDEGVITFMGREVNPTYSIGEGDNSFKKCEAIKDWARYHMGSYLPYGFKIYRCLII